MLDRYHRVFDPYAYILLNLFLSMLAAIQAPIILMSQNRQAQKDRIGAEQVKMTANQITLQGFQIGTRDGASVHYMQSWAVRMTSRTD